MIISVSINWKRLRTQLFESFCFAFFRWWDTNVSKMEMGKLQVVTANMTCEKVLNTMKKFGVDQVPVVTNNG